MPRKGRELRTETIVTNARRAYAAPMPTDRTRAPRVREREANRRAARATKYAAAPLNLDALAAELATVGGTK